MTSTIRMPAVAGRFYSSDPETLEGNVNSYIAPPQARVQALGCIVPHAGYVYSGHVAGAVFAKLAIPLTCIILCPNHTGMGQPLAIVSEGTWNTPLGSVHVDAELADTLKVAFPTLCEDRAAHRAEHAIEVQLPFLQVEQPQSKIVPIALGTGQFEVLEALGEAIAGVLNSQEDRALLIASSDMNHYESDAITRVKDRMAIDRILERDPRGLFDTIKREQISMCGFGPTITMLTAANLIGASEAELVTYATSGDVSGDREMVVGYCGIIVK
jgi:AmmeMemoRadiSam system protein B